MPGLVPGIRSWHNQWMLDSSAITRKVRTASRKRRGRVSRTPIATARVSNGTAVRPARKPRCQQRNAERPPRPRRLAIRAKSGQWVYTFGGGKAQGRAGMRDLLGGKGANLAEMANLGLPVPPGFTITTEVCTHYYANEQTLSEGPGEAGRRRRSPTSAKHHRRGSSATAPTRCWSRCAPARAPRCPA